MEGQQSAGVAVSRIGSRRAFHTRYEPDLLVTFLGPLGPQQIPWASDEVQNEIYQTALNLFGNGFDGDTSEPQSSALLAILKPRGLPETYDEARNSFARWTEAVIHVTQMKAINQSIHYKTFLAKRGGGIDFGSLSVEEGDISRLKKAVLANHRLTQQNATKDANTKVAHAALNVPHLYLPELRNLPATFQRRAIQNVRNTVLKKVHINIDSKLPDPEPEETKQEYSPAEKKQQVVQLVRDFRGMTDAGKLNTAIAIMSSWLSDCDLDELYSRHNPEYLAVAREVRTVLISSFDCGAYTTWRYKDLSKQEKLVAMVSMLSLWVDGENGMPDPEIGIHLQRFLAEVEEYHSE